MSFITISPIKSYVPKIKMNKKLAQKLNLSKKKMIISYGNRKYQLFVETNDHVSEGIIEIDQRSIKRLMIDTQFQYNYRYEQGRFIIGPLIGFLVSHYKSYLKKRVFNKKKEDRFRPYIKMAEQVGGIIYYFTLT